MVTNNKVLTVSYGTFSCTLEGFEDNFDTMKAIAEYFRDLAADDRYFGAEPPTPDAEMLARIAEREIERRVQARTDQGTLVLTASDAIADHQEEIEDEVPETPVADPVDQVAEGEETVAIDEDELAEERVAFFAEADTIAEEHAADVAEDIAAHETEHEAVAESAESIERDTTEVVSEDVDTQVEDDEVSEVEVAEEAAIAPTQEDNSAEESLADDVMAQETAAEKDPLEQEEVSNELNDTFAKADDEDLYEEDDDDVESAPVEAADTYDDVDDADNFFAGTKAQHDEGVSSIAAKLSRIRAVVSKAEQNDADADYTEDEHAENPAADFLRKSANDIEGSLEDEDDMEAALAPATGRVIRMRRSDAAVEAEEASPPIQAEAEAAPSIEDELDDALAEEEVAEFENGYETTELDEETYDEEILEETPPTPRQRANLTEDAPQEESVDRLLDEANTKLDDPDTSRRRTTLAHLRAAVAATRAEKSAGTYEGDKDQSGAYREDLADVMRPSRAGNAMPTETTEEESTAAAPLRLVASQRVDAPPAREEGVRPRRVSPADIQSFEPREDNGFTAYAEEVGATELPDILEAAASYLTFVEGRRRFSRPMLMRLAYQLGPDRFQREAGLRSFGQLLRDKKIEKIAGGRFTAAETIRFKPESAAS